jgi:aryl-alcohol dehydrogenase-like predicted oxidoreductase
VRPSSRFDLDGAAAPLVVQFSAMSELGLGCVRLGSIAAGQSWRDSVRLVHHALDHGVTYFDTADSYGAGASETLLGTALRGRRSGVTVATKGGYLFTPRSPAQLRLRSVAARALGEVRRRRGRSPITSKSPSTASPAESPRQDFSPAYLTKALDASLRRLATDHVDVYQLHGPRSADPDQVAAWSTEMIASGRINRLGVGAESLDQVHAWSDVAAVASVQLPFGILDPEAGDELIPSLHERGRAVVARGVLGAGLLADPALLGDDRRRSMVADFERLGERCGVSLVQLALWFVRMRQDVDVVLVGASSAAHLDELRRIPAEPPDASTAEQIDDIVRRHRVPDDAS